MSEHRSKPQKSRRASQSGPQNTEKNALQKPWQKGVAKRPITGAARATKQKNEESKVYGDNACRVLFQQRPESIIRLYLNADMAAKFSDVMKYMAQQKKAYHIVEDQELEKIAASAHHGGIVLLVKRKPVQSLASYLQQQKGKTDCLLALDGVGNPHNLGAISRSCAHFGVNGVIMQQPELLQSGAALRTAEGGGEFIAGLSCDSLALSLQLCKQAGYTLLTTSSHNGVSLYQTKLPAKVVVVFGEEMFGVSKSVAKTADIAVQIPGSGKVESLNVSVAASLIIAEWYRQQL